MMINLKAAGNLAYRYRIHSPPVTLVEQAGGRQEPHGIVR
jgi:hypothetical protein